MGKQKKQSRRRRRVAISTSGLRGMADQLETAPVYQSRFDEGDMVWLADEYQRRSRFEPSLTLEDFAAEYGVSADELRTHVPDLSRNIDHSITLWHGTTMSRAESILQQGFRARKSKRHGQIFFAGRPGMARGIAERRARDEDDEPALIMCSIDLSHYSDFERRGNAVYAFRCGCIASEVITKIDRLSRQRREKLEKRENAESNPTDVAITFNSGGAGIAYWINSYLKLSGQGEVGENHEAVAKIKQWLGGQAEAGRFGEVPYNEMLEQVREYLPQYLQ
jgi:hypothetical protein